MIRNSKKLQVLLIVFMSLVLLLPSATFATGLKQNLAEPKNEQQFGDKIDFEKGVAYYIYSGKAGKTLVAETMDSEYGWHLADSSNVYIKGDVNDQSDMWLFDKTADGHYTIKNLHTGAWLCYDNNSQSIYPANATNSMMFLVDSTNFEFDIRYKENGAKREVIIPAHHEQDCVLSVDGSEEDGTNVKFETYSGKTTQGWLTMSVRPSYKVQEGVYRIRSLSTGKYLEEEMPLYGGPTPDGATGRLHVQFWNSPEVACTWQVENTEDGFVTIRNEFSGAYISLPGSEHYLRSSEDDELPQTLYGNHSNNEYCKVMVERGFGKLPQYLIRFKQRDFMKCLQAVQSDDDYRNVKLGDTSDEDKNKWIFEYVGDLYRNR